MARGRGLRRQPGPVALGAGRLRPPLEAPRPPVLGLAAFRPGAAALLETTSPRAWAFGLLGICHYLQRLAGARPASQARDVLARRLLDRFEATATDDWRWFEDRLTYDNARLAQGLIASGRSGGDPEALRIGLESLDWLVKHHKSPSGHFRPIGCNGFFVREQGRAQFDQQPVEAHAMISASLEAYHATENPDWLAEARLAFEWFLGGNDLGLELYDSKSGGCCDGLQEDRINQNQGAESTLAFLLSLAEMKLLESILAPHRQVQTS